jgi:hypothetical protein
MMSLWPKWIENNELNTPRPVPDGPPLRVAFLGLGSYANRVAEAILRGDKTINADVEFEVNTKKCFLKDL